MTVPELLSILPRIPTITVVDIGAMTIAGDTDKYQQLIDAGVANIIGFEPVEEECAKLQKSAGKGRTYLPYAIGDGTTQPFHICNFAMTSSLLVPNHALTNQYSGLSELMQVVKTVEIKTHRLDDIPEVSKTDFLKIDIQGAELQVFKSAKHVLSNTLMIQSEVEFVPLYKDQPLYGDVDAFLRSIGMMVHRFSTMCGRPLRPIPFIPGPIGPTITQALWCDAYFIRDIAALDTMNPDRLLKFAVLAHCVSDSIDLAYRCLLIYDRLMDTDLAMRYMRRFSRRES